MAKVTITRGGSGKWIADSGCGYGDIASGHVPIRAGDWEQVVIRQMTRQANGEPDPGVRLGGGYNTTIDVPDDVVERLAARAKAAWEEKEKAIYNFSPWDR